MLNLAGLWHRLREHFVRLLERPADELGRTDRAVVYQVRLGRLCWQHAMRGRLLVVAGHLTYKTLLGIIPALVLVMLVINFFARGEDIGREVENRLLDALNITDIYIDVGGEATDLASRIRELVESAQSHINAAAAVGVVILFLIAMSALATVEEAMNATWEVSARRSLGRRFILFWLILTLSPPAAALAVYGSIRITQAAGFLPAWLVAAGEAAIGLAAVWFVLFVLYKLLPNTIVRTRAALAGAIVAGTLWHVLAKSAFAYYVKHAVGYGQMYGNLGLIPLFLLWVYVTWVFVLFGSELAYVVQNYADLARARALLRQRDRFLAFDFAALVAMALAARRFRDGLGPTPLKALVEATAVDPALLEELLGRLETAGLLARASAAGGAENSETAYLPAREPDRVLVSEVLAAVRSRPPVPIDPRHLALHNDVRAAYEQVLRGCDAAGGRLTVADLAAAHLKSEI